MYNDEETTWFQQTLLSYKDTTEGTDGYLRISINSNTKDYINFNAPSLNINIKDNLYKNTHINYSNSRDLITSFKELVKIPPTELFSNTNLYQIQKRYQKNQDLIFEFKTNVNGEYVLVIMIKNNETDFSKIIVPASMLKDIMQLIIDFNKNYIQVSNSIILKASLRQLIKLDDVTREIKGLHSRIEGLGTHEQNNENIITPELNNELIESTRSTMDDLDEFLGENMKNITVDEIDDSTIETKPVYIIESEFINNILKNDLSMLEPIIMNKRHMLDFIEFLEPQISNKFNMLPNISDKQIKSLVYMSTLTTTFKEKNYIENGASLPSSAPIFKYESKEHTEDNLNLAYDLLLIQAFIKLFRIKMENKETNVYTNKALYHIKLRGITDPLIYSFVDKFKAEELTSIISLRYSYYDKMGFFKKYTDIIKEYNHPEIKLIDIQSFIKNICDKGFNTPYIIELHNSQIMSSKLRLTTKNNFNLEQIVNEIIPLEVNEKLNRTINFDETSDVIKQLFTKEIKKPIIRPENNLTPIQSYAQYFSKDFKDQEQLVSYLLDYSDKKINFDIFPFPLHEFEEMLVKGLYLWDPEHMKSKKSIIDTVGEDPLTKELIIPMVNHNTSEENGATKWNL